MIVAVKHFAPLAAANTTSVSTGAPVRTTSQDWEMMLDKFASKICEALSVRNIMPVQFVVPDLVGIYSSDGVVSFDARMSDDGREYVVSYALRPIVVHPKQLLEQDTDVPESYSEINQDLTRVMEKQFSATQHNHWFWRLYTIRAKHVIAGQNYRVDLVFRRD